MPNLSVDLYDDAYRVILARLNVVCTEAQARYLESLTPRARWKARHLPQRLGHNLTFNQFQQQFLKASGHDDDDAHL
ncbi:MAG: hypothetical protein HY741_05385 [Chloroflexi bacterium]|nr:hypothetical protein [Chloroflexota bacterium]